MVWACTEKRRRIRRQESDGDGGAGEKNERTTGTEVLGQHQERLVRKRIVSAQDQVKWRRLIRNIDST